MAQSIIDYQSGAKIRLRRVFTALLLAAAAWLPGPTESMAQRPKSTVSPPKPVLTRVVHSQREWTLHTEVILHALSPRPNDPRDIGPVTYIQLDGCTLFFPLIHGSAMHDAFPAQLRSEVWLENRQLNIPVAVKDGYQGGCSLAMWSVAPINTRMLRLVVEHDMKCYETRIDEVLARKRPWPTDPWSAEMALCLQSQAFVEVQSPAVQELVARWVGGNPRDMPPYELAKMLAGRVIEHYRSVEGLIVTSARGPAAGFNSGSVLSGFRVYGAEQLAAVKDGTDYDLACLLTAVYRAVGIPARLVIGFDVEKSRKFEDAPIFRAWVEFFLPHELAPLPPTPPASAPGSNPPVVRAVTMADGEWIPVDIAKQREFSSRPPAQNLRWEYFGNNTEFDMMVPVSYHWIPPENVVNAGVPGFWGWQPSPAVPGVEVELKFWAFETPKRGPAPPGR